MVAMNTKNLSLVPHFPAHLLALMEGEAVYEKSSGMRVANGVRDFLLAGSADYFAQLRIDTNPDPWKIGFGIVHKIDNLLIGLCAFTGPPDPDGIVEIAYSIAPAYQRKGLATEAAAALVEFATQSGRVRTVIAHTLAEINPSTRVLEKCGFKKTAEVIDEENILIWRWEKSVSSAPNQM